MELEENEEYRVIYEERKIMNEDGDELMNLEVVGFLDIHNEHEMITEGEEIFPGTLVLDGYEDGYKLITDVPQHFIDDSEGMGNFDLVETFDDYDKAVEYIKNLEKVKYEKGKFWDDGEEDDEDFDS